jgi:integrase/recombinase XerD
VKRSKRTLEHILEDSEATRKQPRLEASSVDTYLHFLRIERGLSPNSLVAYERDLKKLEEFLAPLKIPIQRVHSTDLQKFIRSLGEVGLERSSITRQLSSLRGYYRYLLTERLLTVDPTETLELKSARRTLPDVLTIAEVEAILDQPDLTTQKGVRDKAILEFLYASGARVSELTTLTLNQIWLEDGLVKLFGKGSKERVVPIGRVARESLDRYLSTIRPLLMKAGKRTDAIFLNQKRGTALSRMTIYNLMQEYAGLAKIEKRLSPHTFRHSFATHLLEGGADLRIVQELLGHADISTTEIYTHVDRSYLKEVHRTFHPRG